VDRSAYLQSGKFKGAAGALRSWIREHGLPTEVVHRARVDFEQQTIWIGCEDGQSLYRITPEKIGRLPNSA
jgi:hypothetical protein